MLCIMHHHEFSVMIHGNKNETEQCDISILWYLVEIIKSRDRVQTAASVTENKKPEGTDILTLMLIVELTE